MLYFCLPFWFLSPRGDCGFGSRSAAFSSSAQCSWWRVLLPLAGPRTRSQYLFSTANEAICQRSKRSKRAYAKFFIARAPLESSCFLNTWISHVFPGISRKRFCSATCENVTQDDESTSLCRLQGQRCRLLCL